MKSMIGRGTLSATVLVSVAELLAVRVTLVMAPPLEVTNIVINTVFRNGHSTTTYLAVWASMLFLLRLWAALLLYGEQPDAF